MWAMCPVFNPNTSSPHARIHVVQVIAFIRLRREFLHVMPKGDERAASWRNPPTHHRFWNIDPNPDQSAQKFHPSINGARRPLV
jgi:hypothetical protein